MGFLSAKMPTIAQPGELTWPFRLGDRVRDKINGLEGIAISRYFHITGCDRFAVELDPKDGKPGDPYHCDGNRLELVQAFPERHRNEIPVDGPKLGDIALSIMSGISGRVSIIHVPLNGATQVDIQPQWDGKTKTMPDGFFVDAGFVTVITPYVPTEKPKAKVTEPAPATKPERGASRMSVGGLNAR